MLWGESVQWLDRGPNVQPASELAQLYSKFLCVSGLRAICHKGGVGHGGEIELVEMSLLFFGVAGDIRREDRPGACAFGLAAGQISARSDSGGAQFCSRQLLRLHTM